MAAGAGRAPRWGFYQGAVILTAIATSAGCSQGLGSGQPSAAGEGRASLETHQIPGFGQEGPVIATGAEPAYPPPEVRAAHSAVPPRFGFGRPAGEADIAPWDIDVGPDGEGLPEGSGTPAAGAAVYATKCAHCHGLEGEGGANDRLVTPADGSAGRTIGAYWPYATTLFDYVRRAMPYDRPGSLTDQEVYDVTAWLLLQNGLIEAGDRVDRSTLSTGRHARTFPVPGGRPGGLPAGAVATQGTCRIVIRYIIFRCNGFRYTRGKGSFPGDFS